MKRAVLAASLTAAMLAGPSAYGGTIERACLKTDRPNATRRLCSCIQDVANATLSGGERSKVVKFFKNPHKSQSTRQSDRRSDEKFWLKYKQFGKIVARQCG